jgi:hypothetical protein
MYNTGADALPSIPWVAGIIVGPFRLTVAKDFSA